MYTYHYKDLLTAMTKLYQAGTYDSFVERVRLEYGSDTPSSDDAKWRVLIDQFAWDGTIVPLWRLNEIWDEVRGFTDLEDARKLLRQEGDRLSRNADDKLEEAKMLKKNVFITSAALIAATLIIAYIWTRN